ncbi:hypothetical protein RchiOBHm_Chr7g0211951 [Rosa chinensis]|uniref:Uncharacterized protein n=1 Tax=Rosa chinensis TaxID=74649 RepID=A0A2P6PAL9_ROSCH|nr:hypothetical protein RchiOBHm_Chr7g0211951 [Rosa chinensis]
MGDQRRWWRTAEALSKKRRCRKLKEYDTVQSKIGAVENLILVFGFVLEVVAMVALVLTHVWLNDPERPCLSPTPIMNAGDGYVYSWGRNKKGT